MYPCCWAISNSKFKQPSNQKEIHPSSHKQENHYGRSLKAVILLLTKEITSILIENIHRPIRKRTLRLSQSRPKCTIQSWDPILRNSSWNTVDDLWASYESEARYALNSEVGVGLGLITERCMTAGPAEDCNVGWVTGRCVDEISYIV